MKVNTGYADATVKAIYDGLESSLSSAPYLSGSKEIALAASGETGRAIGSGLKVGDKIRLKADMTIDGTITKPIYTQNSTMYKLMTDGKDASNTPGSSASLYSTYDPMTYVAIDKNTTKVWLIEIDGRQEWFSLGVKGYEMYRIADKLGAWNVTRFDGGGSSAMWIYNAEKGSGALVNSPSDSKGERSDMNYILIRKK
jgi:exopolysaccharide biosynthesis protein